MILCLVRRVLVFFTNVSLEGWSPLKKGTFLQCYARTYSLYENRNAHSDRLLFLCEEICTSQSVHSSLCSSQGRYHLTVSVLKNVKLFFFPRITIATFRGMQNIVRVTFGWWQNFLFLYNYSAALHTQNNNVLFLCDSLDYYLNFL